MLVTKERMVEMLREMKQVEAARLHGVDEGQIAKLVWERKYQNRGVGEHCCGIKFKWI